MKCLCLLLAFSMLCSGCAQLAFWRKPSIKAGNVSVTGPQDAGKPATLATSESGESVALPVGSKVIVTKTEAVPATPQAKAEPAKEVTEIIPSAPTVWTKKTETVHADTGTVDTTIAAKRIDSEESRPLLYASIACAAVAVFFVYIHYPTPAALAGAGSVIFFLAWKASGLPGWFWALGLVALAAGAALWLGHHRGLYEPVPTDKK